MARGTTSRDHCMRNAKLERTLSHWAAQASMRIIELENRCTGNRTVGSNPTLSTLGLNPPCVAPFFGGRFLIPKPIPKQNGAWVAQACPVAGEACLVVARSPCRCLQPPVTHCEARRMLVLYHERDGASGAIGRWRICDADRCNQLADCFADRGARQHRHLHPGVAECVEAER